MSSGWCSLDVGDLWVFETSLDVLSGLFSHDTSISLDNRLDNMNTFTSGTVPTSHFTVQLWYGSAKRVISVLLIHVDNISSGLISKYDSVVPNAVGWSLEDFAHGNDLTLSSSDFVLSLHFVPESWSCDNSVLGENSDSIARWLWGLFTRTLSSDDPVLFELKYNKTKSVTLSNKAWTCYFRLILTVFCMDGTPTPLTILLLKNRNNK